MDYTFHIWIYDQDTWLCVSAAKKDLRHTSVLLTGTAKSLFLTPHISKTTILISIKFTYFIPSIYTTLYTKYEKMDK